MKRHRPRKPRNAYRDPLWVRELLRSWIERLGMPDLDRLWREKLTGGSPE